MFDEQMRSRVFGPPVGQTHVGLPAATPNGSLPLLPGANSQITSIPPPVHNLNARPHLPYSLPPVIAAFSPLPLATTAVQARTDSRQRMATQQAAASRGGQGNRVFPSTPPAVEVIDVAILPLKVSTT